MPQTNEIHINPNKPPKDCINLADKYIKYSGIGKDMGHIEKWCLSEDLAMVMHNAALNYIKE